MSLTIIDDRYQVLSRIASGGMGQVFRARDSVLARVVALKVLHSTFAADDTFIDRFRHEARSAANLSHPNIVAVHDWGQRETSFMVMEYVDGPNLRDLLVAHGRLEPAQAVEVLLQMLAALDHAHRRGIVHRDVKPENALVTPDGVVKVADFGLAHALAESRVTQSPGTVTGTVQYLAPEQIHGEPADPRTDLYAVGIVAYELLTGHAPFTGETSLAVAYKHLSQSVPPPSQEAPEVPAQLDRIVLRATAKDPEDRPRSAAEMRGDLQAITGSLPPASPLADLVRSTPARADMPHERATTVTIPQVVAPRRGHRRRAKRRRWPWVVVLLVVALAAGGWATWTYLVPHRTTVPPVLGLPLDTARERLTGAGLHVRLGSPVHSILYAAGTVAQQSRPEGDDVDKGAQIVIRLSEGPPLRTVPSVKGSPLEDARTALTDRAFEVDVVEHYSLTVPRGDVIRQSPGPKSRIAYGSVVHLFVSKGPPPVKIPPVVGSTVDDATAALRAAGFDVERIDRFSDSIPRGDVIRQHPARGTAPKGSTVTIVVSKGPPQFPMPNVAGDPCSSADGYLSGLGLDVHAATIPSSSGNTVVGQSPYPDTTVHPGDSVTIYCA
ncbi:MAG: Stk1 family PASTA domain-containing Ser/Thr kinase [Actinomycetota bacterium]